MKELVLVGLQYSSADRNSPSAEQLQSVETYDTGTAAVVEDIYHKSVFYHIQQVILFSIYFSSKYLTKLFETGIYII